MGEVRHEETNQLYGTYLLVYRQLRSHNLLGAFPGSNLSVSVLRASGTQIAF